MSENWFSTIPEALRNIPSLTELDSLFSNLLSLLCSYFHCLYIYIVGSNDLTDVPAWLCDLPKLQILYCMFIKFDYMNIFHH